MSAVPDNFAAPPAPSPPTLTPPWPLEHVRITHAGPGQAIRLVARDGAGRTFEKRLYPADCLVLIAALAGALIGETPKEF